MYNDSCRDGGARVVEEEEEEEEEEGMKARCADDALRRSLGVRASSASGGARAPNKNVTVQRRTSIQQQ